jgi:predicted Zn-dependent protease
VYRGLIDFAASDDELAGVLAHEIGHNARMHALRGEAKAKKLSWASLAAMAAMLAGGRSGADVAQFSQYLLIGVINGYGVGYEKEADSAAVTEMARTDYNPSALVTFMQRLQLKEERSPEVHLGIFQTHPPSEERAAACLAAIKAAGLTYAPREVTGAKVATVVEKPDRYQVVLGDLNLMELARGNPPSKGRAQAAADHVNALLRDGLQAYQLSATADGRVLGQSQEIIAATPADAALKGLTVQATAQSWLESFRRLFWKERINGKF